ncbi:hypothetical protein [Salipaludibacillus sp. CF4.18]|uniref:hypothetical protein n=1 Tax=Salipaludibacillus sp. CF4.18 TaxID=3373081 RepID=UPI003EE7E97F
MPIRIRRPRLRRPCEYLGTCDGPPNWSSVLFPGLPREVAEPAEKLVKGESADIVGDLKKLPNYNDLTREAKDAIDKIGELHEDVGKYMKEVYDKAKDFVVRYGDPLNCAKELADAFYKMFVDMKGEAQMKEEAISNEEAVYLGLIAACSAYVGGFLVATGTIMKAASQGSPNPHADTLISKGAEIGGGVCLAGVALIKNTYENNR